MKIAQNGLYIPGKGIYDTCGIMVCWDFFFEDLHISLKLSNEHINLTLYWKMNVRLPAQILS